jgi:hypothetical protein
METKYSRFVAWRPIITASGQNPQRLHTVGRMPSSFKGLLSTDYVESSNSSGRISMAGCNLLFICRPRAVVFLAPARQFAQRRALRVDLQVRVALRRLHTAAAPNLADGNRSTPRLNMMLAQE